MIADRFKLQQSWWLASELGRRHQGVWIERFDHDTNGPVLVAFDPDRDARVFFDLAHGVVAMHEGQKAHWGWDAVLGAMGAHDLLKRLEVSSGLGVPSRAPATGARSIVYRLIARMLAMHIDAPRPWVPVPIAVEPMIQGATEPTDDPLLVGFDTVHADVLEHRKRALAQFERPEQIGIRPYLWAMTRDVDTAFVLDTDGFVHTRAVGVRPLLEMYDELDRDIDRLAVAVLHVAGATRR